MRAEIAAKPVVYRLPGMDSVNVRPNVPYSGGLRMDLYYPPEASSAPSPAVVIVLGYRDVEVPLPFGCQFREMEGNICWARLFAASGMIGVAYETRDPSSDALAVLSHLRENAAGLGIDPARIGIWSASGNVPVALSAIMQGGIRCAALCYGFTLDLEGATAVAQSSAQFYFANPAAGRGIEDLPPETALLLARAGKDQFPGLNSSMDAFAAAALRANLQLTLVNHPTGPHAFDLMDDSDASRDVIRAILDFLKRQLEA